MNALVGLAILCHLISAVAAGFEPTVLFDLEHSGYRESVEIFAAGTRDLDLDPSRDDVRIPYILPGPVDPWAGSTSHALRFRLSRPPRRTLTLQLYAVETHDASPPVLSISLGDRELARLKTRPGTGLPPPHEQRGVR